MKQDMLHQAEEYNQKHHRKKRWKKVMFILSSIVVFCTVYALVLPALTMEKQCEIPEHTHSESSYESGELSCTLTEHVHTEKCEIDNETEKENNEKTESLDLKEDEEKSSEKTEDSKDIVAFKVTRNSGESEDSKEGELEAFEEDHSSTTPMELNQYIDSEASSLSYRISDKEEWKTVTENVIVPGNASLHLTIEYKNVPIDTLVNSGYQMSCTLPDVMRDISANAGIMSGSTQVGTIEVNEKTVILTFKKSWIKEQQDAKQTVISGEFYVESGIDLAEASDNWPGKLVIGKLEIPLEFEDNLIVKHGDAKIEKEITKDSKTNRPILSNEGKDDKGKDKIYLSYTLKVTAGEYGAKDLWVKDIFTKNKDYIESYVDMKPGKGTIEQKDGGIVWTIGDMKPDEVCTLTYKVKVKDTYIGAGSKGSMVNEAKLYSDYSENGETHSIEKDRDSSEFSPIAKGTLSKVVADTHTENADGSITIHYTIWVHADEKNSYTLDNVKIRDALDGTIDPGEKKNNHTDERYRQYLSYIPESFQLYKGGQKDQNGTAGLTTPCSDGNGLSIEDTDRDGSYNDSFTYEVGSLAPGESKTLVYSVKVAPGVFTEAGNAEMKIGNRVTIYAVDEREHKEDKRLESFNASKYLKKMWDRKMVGSQMESEETISMGDKGSFQVPAGSFRYQVVVNEAGDWDVSAAVMKDHFANYMQFCGYVRVDAYEIAKENAPSADMTNQAVIDKLNALNPVKTSWINVDGKTEFSFTPKDIDLGEGNYAYLLTYYAKPVNIENVTSIKINNSFTLSGVVTHGNYTYNMPGQGVTVQAAVTVEGGNNYAANKSAWYYEKPKGSSKDYEKGTLYWAIKVDSGVGKAIPAGTRLKDVIGSGDTHYIRSDSLVGAYTGNLGEEQITDFENLKALLDSGKLTELSTNYYGEERKESGYLTIQIKEDIRLEKAHSLYIIVKTAPGVLPEDPRKVKQYGNDLYTSYDGTSWILQNSVSQKVYGDDGIFKELKMVVNWDGTNAKPIGSGNVSEISTEGLEKGTYVFWQIQINCNGNLSGQYRIEEQIPEGMELAYVRYFWYGPGYKNRPHTVQQTDVSGYTETVSNRKDKGNKYTEPVYYYTKDNTAFWNVDGLQKGGVDEVGVEFQIACRVIDSEILLGGQTKQFVNKVTLKSQDGKKDIATSSSSASIKREHMIVKSGNAYNSATDGGRYPFEIVVNPLGEDLVKGSETITLMDTMSKNLILDTTSIQVIDTSKNKPVKWTASVDGQTLELELPDDRPLKITYTALINAAPNEPVSFDNKAYWKGYEASESGKVNVENFKYQIGGTVGADTSPKITVLKKDQNNVSTLLEGAEFTLQEGIYMNQIFTPTEGCTWSDDTDAKGEITFGKKETLKFNTLYCLTETNPPDGYKENKQPYYFVIVREDKPVNYSELPADTTVYYQDAHYIHEVFNSKGEITVAKKFCETDGSSCNPIAGTYTFGLYDAPAPGGKLLQTETITYTKSDNEANKTAVFKDLSLTDTYYVYELDDNNEPITDGSAQLINNTPFIVSYHSEGTDAGENGAKDGGTVTVTNRCGGPELPETGGTGTFLYKLGGLFLIAAGVFLLYKYKKRGKEESASF